MTTAAYSAALDSAYRAATPPAVIFGVKQAIINQVRELDSSVKARTTDFFNHSFAPDIILSWGSAERPLFVRQDIVDAQLEDDLELMQRERPIIFGLEPALLREELLRETAPAARQSSALITDASGINEVVERKENRVVRIAAPALLQGGRGVLDERAAAVVSSGLARGFISAQNVALSETREAVRLIEFAFQPATADRMIEFLRAVWIGGGGSSTAFPGASHIQQGLTDEALHFLLEFEQNDNLEFWRRVGSGLTLDRLISNEYSPSRNLDALIAANLDRISAKACSVAPHVLRLEEETATTATGVWHRRGETLAWQNDELIVQFGESRESVRSAAEETSGVTLQELLTRAASVRLPFESVEMIANARKIEYSLSEEAAGQDVIDDPALRSMAASLGASGLVGRAVASIPGAASMVLDFTSSMASGRTAARFTLADLLTYAVPLLSTLSAETAVRIESMLTLNRSTFEPPSLFDFDIDE